MASSRGLAAGGVVERLASVKLVVTDVDGTITRARGDILLSLEAVSAIRALESAGVRVSLVSGNSLPVTVAIAHYAGARGPVVAENGCVGFFNGRVEHLASGRTPPELVEELEALGLRGGWQNAFRFHDAAFPARPGVTLEDVVKVVSRYPGFKVLWSGYAFHVAPAGCGKDIGLKWAAKVVGVDVSEVVAVGDGGNDVDMLRVAGIPAAPGDASVEAKAAALIVAKAPGGRGFAEIAYTILAAKEELGEG